MSVVVAAGCAGAAAAVLLALPRAAPVRLQGLTATATAPANARPADLTDRPRGIPSRRQRVLLAVALAALLAVAAGPAVSLLVLAGSAAGLRWWSGRARSRAEGIERDSAVEACSALAGELRAGRSAAEALQAAASVAAGGFALRLHAAAATARLGGDVGAALLSSSGPTAVEPVLRGLAACWTVCAGTGSGLAAAVERLEEGLRAERARQRALDAELASPRATAALLAVLPAAGLLMAAGLGADPLHVLLHTPVGLACLVGGLALDAVGLLWTQRLAARVLEQA
jgi:tight adherence protein B